MTQFEVNVEKGSFNLKIDFFGESIDFRISDDTNFDFEKTIFFLKFVESKEVIP